MGGEIICTISAIRRCARGHPPAPDVTKATHTMGRHNAPTATPCACTRSRGVRAAAGARVGVSGTGLPGTLPRSPAPSTPPRPPTSTLTVATSRAANVRRNMASASKDLSRSTLVVALRNPAMAAGRVGWQRKGGRKKKGEEKTTVVGGLASLHSQPPQRPLLRLSTKEEEKERAQP